MAYQKVKHCSVVYSTCCLHLVLISAWMGISGLSMLCVLHLSCPLSNNPTGLYDEPNVPYSLPQLNFQLNNRWKTINYVIVFFLSTFSCIFSSLHTTYEGLHCARPFQSMVKKKEKKEIHPSVYPLLPIISASHQYSLFYYETSISIILGLTR